MKPGFYRSVLQGRGWEIVILCHVQELWGGLVWEGTSSLANVTGSNAALASQALTAWKEALKCTGIPEMLEMLEEHLCLWARLAEAGNWGIGLSQMFVVRPLSSRLKLRIIYRITTSLTWAPEQL